MAPGPVISMLLMVCGKFVNKIILSSRSVKKQYYNIKWTPPPLLFLKHKVANELLDIGLAQSTISGYSTTDIPTAGELNTTGVSTTTAGSTITETGTSTTTGKSTFVLVIAVLNELFAQELKDRNSNEFKTLEMEVEYIVSTMFN